MTLFDVDAIYAHWRRYPPVRKLVADFIGFKPSEAVSDTSQHLTAEEFQRLVQATGGKMPT